ncbi:DUF4157 domain-containing protein [Streptomyces sp. NPDC050636]|uniref:eCIS core domain-containing protein n=1 Tax=Streptomyces sp. NPDC050636 TaxID=3154510 RepID=UPI00342FA421
MAAREQHQHGPACGHTAPPPVQRSAVQDVLRTPGRPLDDPVRTDMESRLGADFSDVRVHTDTAAHESAESVNAHAYTSGSHIVFQRGRYDASSASGRHMLAHELTHVIQQRSGPVAGTDRGDGTKVSDPSDRFEREAEANAARAMSPGAAAVQRATAHGMPHPPEASGPRAGHAEVQRAMHMANADERIYKDSNDEAEDYAYLYRLDSHGPLFVTHTALRRFREQVAQAEGDPVDHVAALGDIYALHSREDRLVRINDALGRAAKGVARHAYDKGASVWQTGGGSRLPAARGYLITLGMNRNEALETLGAQLDGFPHVEFQKATREDQYQALKNELTAEFGDNCYEHSAHERKIFYVSTVRQKRSDTHSVRTGGQRRDDAFFASLRPGTEDWDGVHREFRELPAADATSGWVSGRTISSMDRGAGQDAAMHNWNALAAASYARQFLGMQLPLDQNWEWLHVRGAQLGGRTEGGNLVPGLFSANSAMIPWENMILDWAGAGADTFWAKFDAEPIPGTPFAKSIRLSIKAVGHPQLGSLEGVLGSFDPLSGRTVDKLAGEFVKRAADQRVRSVG